MNILDEIENVKKRKQKELCSEKEKQQKLEKEYQAKQKLEKGRIEVIWNACKSLNESDKFRIEREKEYIYSGYIATIYKIVKKEKIQIAIIKVESDSYEWRGSDESPEQTIYTKNLRLYSNSNNPVIDVGFDDCGFQDYLAEFLRLLAEFLVDE